MFFTAVIQRYCIATKRAGGGVDNGIIRNVMNSLTIANVFFTLSERVLVFIL
jgi:hypothetical protein